MNHYLEEILLVYFVNTLTAGLWIYRTWVSA